MAPPRRELPDYDQTLKRLLLRAHDEFLALLAPGLAWRAERSPELPATARRADLVWEVERPDGQVGLVHIELQTKPEPNIGWRRRRSSVRSGTSSPVCWCRCRACGCRVSSSCRRYGGR